MGLIGIVLIKNCKEIILRFINKIKLSKNNFSLKYNILLAFLCLFAFFAPDFIFKIFKVSNVKFELAFTIAFFLFGLVISMIQNKKVVYFIIFIFFIFEAISFHYMAYFGKPITSFEIKKIFTERNDIIESGFAYFSVVWYILPLMFITYGIYLYFIFKYSDKCFKTKIAYIILILILLAKPERAYRKSLKNFLPGPTRNSIHNTLNTFSYFFVKEIWTNHKQVEIPFLKYDITKIPNYSKPDIVIFLVAESLNYRNLSLYGYKKETTPFLNSLKNSPNFVYKKAISSSISTASSLPLLFNVIREPGNFALLNNKNTNLFKLAKNNSFYTYFLTSQESKILNDLGIEFTDSFSSKDNDITSFKIKKDDFLLEKLENILFSNKSTNKSKFISIFSRNLHSPYSSNYLHHKEKFKIWVGDGYGLTRFESTNNDYNNAVLYEDYFISSIISKINRIKNKSIILIITSDHGQMLGEDNMYGHNMLDIRVAEVPFMIYFNDKFSPNFNLKIQNHISHYEISKLLARILGYEITNPNENGKFFISGSEIYYDNVILPYSNLNGEIKLESISSTYKYFTNF